LYIVLIHKAKAVHHKDYSNLLFAISSHGREPIKQSSNHSKNES
jgi:hypothetical protein